MTMPTGKSLYRRDRRAIAKPNLATKFGKFDQKPETENERKSFETCEEYEERNGRLRRWIRSNSSQCFRSV